ncbi:hypothetical protein HN51_008537 [Arachis hypogaea]
MIIFIKDVSGKQRHTVPAVAAWPQLAPVAATVSSNGGSSGEHGRRRSRQWRNRAGEATTAAPTDVLRRALPPLEPNGGRDGARQRQRLQSAGAAPILLRRSPLLPGVSLSLLHPPPSSPVHGSL